MHDGMWLILELLAMDDEARRRLINLIVKVKGDRSQRQFALDLDVSLGAVQNWLQGRVPSSENLEKIATSAGMTIEELFQEIRGEEAGYTPHLAEDVLQIALQLDNEQRRRLIKLLVDYI
jgi:transcriptional regulator with XRE-family HTH domain